VWVRTDWFGEPAIGEIKWLTRPAHFFPLLSVVREYRVEPPGENDATLLALPCSKIKTYWWVPATMSSWIKEDALVVAVCHAELRPPKVLKQRRNK